MCSNVCESAASLLKKKKQKQMLFTSTLMFLGPRQDFSHDHSGINACVQVHAG